MATDKLFQRHFISMPALGRLFKPGDLYSYSDDEIPGKISSGPMIFYPLNFHHIQCFKYILSSNRLLSVMGTHYIGISNPM